MVSAQRKIRKQGERNESGQGAPILDMVVRVCFPE